MKKDKMYGYRLLKPILGWIFKFYYHPKIIGKENIPKEGPIIIAGNHKHLYDQCLAILATKRPIHYMAKREYFEGKMAWFFKFVGCIPVNRSKKDPNATKQALKVLNQGYALGIFPEGTRNKTKKTLLPFKYGAVSLANKTGSTIVPFGITGKYCFRSKDLTIRFGKPYQIKKDLETENQKLFHEIENLIQKNLQSKE